MHNAPRPFRGAKPDTSAERKGLVAWTHDLEKQVEARQGGICDEASERAWLVVWQVRPWLYNWLVESGAGRSESIVTRYLHVTRDQKDSLPKE